MPKEPTYPTIIDNLLKLDIFLLWKWSKQAECRDVWCGNIQWSRNGKKTADINAECRWNEQKIILRYKYDGEPVKQVLLLQPCFSNLPKGGFFYKFMKPVKGIGTCSMLYMYDGKFIERQAIHCGMYEAQTESKSFRNSPFKVLLRLDNSLKNEMKTKYVMYNGRRTRKQRTIDKMEERNNEAYKNILMNGIYK